MTKEAPVNQWTNKNRRWLGIIAFCAFSACTPPINQDNSDTPELLIFAAASLRDVITELGSMYEEKNKVRLIYNFAGSNVLAEQIAAAPKADLYISANEKWMDTLEEKGAIDISSRRDFLSNRLVIIAHKNSPFKIEDPAQLCTVPFTYLSIAHPQAVPAGHYARFWLERCFCEKTNVWEKVQDRLVPSPDVRAAMNLVEANPQILGIVYKTDATSSKRVRVLYEVPDQESPDIRYSAAVLSHRPFMDKANAFLEFLNSKIAKTVFEKQGFIPIIKN
ncbi:MAG: molybdate ABC transporter substrate-binding protein [Kiritimatiellae bacterium]|nr:molybdate ABC transporter substrate-binding protein [Kiritimatiellia bacterium]